MTYIGFVQEHQEHEHSFAHNILLGSKACNAYIATTYGQHLWLSGEEELDSTQLNPLCALDAPVLPPLVPEVRRWITTSVCIHQAL